MIYLITIALVFLSIIGSSAPASTTTTTTTVSPSSYPIITSWVKSTGNGTGAYNETVANVYGIYYTSTKVYIQANGIPSYAIGPWAANPNTASGQAYTTSFPLTPTVLSTKNATALGANGFFTNGIPFFNAWDGTYYDDITVWERNAYYGEGVSFDDCYGHPASGGVYHTHVNPICLYDYTDSSVHSPIIGFAFDGYPLYGPFGYSSANDSSSSIKRLVPSYTTRTYTNNERTYLSNGTVLSASEYGPNVNSTYYIGLYLADYEYVSGLGDLDEYNGRWCVTPDYPSGTYAYFIATNSSGSVTYPYTIGPNYYGKVTVTGTSLSLPSSYSTYYS